MTGPPASPALRLSAVTREYAEASGPLRVLGGVNLTISRGEVVVLQGPSGSGKTTLLQIAGCLSRASSGTVEVLGENLGEATESARIEARRRYLGFVFQQFHLLDALPVLDNVALGLRLKGRPLDVDLVDGLLEELGLTARRATLPSRLSGGEKQRTAIARALVSRPALLLADEPTSQLDSTSALTVCDLLSRTVRHARAAALVTTHDPRVHHIADRVLTLKDGVLHE